MVCGSAGCWSLCSCSSLMLVPVLHSWVQGELFARKQWQRKEWRAGLCLVDLLILPYFANTNMTVSVIAALVFYSNLIIALFWASEERWEVKVLRNKKSYRNHISLPFWLLFLLSQKIAEWLGCLLCKISWFKSLQEKGNLLQKWATSRNILVGGMTVLFCQHR